MNDNEAGTQARPVGILAKPFPSPWTPRAVFLMGILCGVMGLGMALVATITLTDANRWNSETIENALWLGGIAVGSLVGAALLFERAWDGYRHHRRHVRPLSFRGQLAAAGFASLVCGFMAVVHVLDGQWERLPLFLLNPMMLLTWFGVAHKRAQARVARESMRVSEDSLIAEAALTPSSPASSLSSGHWWTRYRTEQDSGDQAEINRQHR